MDGGEDPVVIGASVMGGAWWSEGLVSEAGPRWSAAWCRVGWAVSSPAGWWSAIPWRAEQSCLGCQPDGPFVAAGLVVVVAGNRNAKGLKIGALVEDLASS